MTAYEALQGKFKAEVSFRPFFKIEALSSREFREQRINLPDYTAIIFSSRHAIDAYFKLAEDLRFKVPETMKYFCTTELVANYLQKHIVYRKRKIFFGNGTPDSVVALIGIALVSLLCCIFQFAVGRRTGRREGSRIEASQAFGQKNTVFGIWMGYTFWNPLVSVAGGFYTIWHNIHNTRQLYKAKK